MRITQNEATAAERRIPFLAVRAQANSVIDLDFNDIATAEVATPGAPTVTPQGTTGATAYSYKIVARNANGETLASTAGSTSTGNATLDGTNFNRVTWTAVTGATSYDVYRSASGGTPSTTGKIVSATTATTADDTGLAAAGSEPASNTTADRFTLTWSGQTTATVKYTADFSAALQTAIEGLSNFAAGDVEVDLQSGVLYRIYVGGQWVSQSIALPTVTPTGFAMGDITGGVSDSAVTDVAFAAADLEVSKVGGAFAASTGTIAEMGHGIYYYQAAAADVDTLGPLVATNVKLGLSVHPPSAQILEAVDASGGIMREGTAQGGTSNSITLDAGASSISDFYVPCLVEPVGGTGASQKGLIGESYNGTTKLMSVRGTWAVVVDNTTQFRLRRIAAVPIADIGAEVQDRILLDGTPFAGVNVDAAISSRATPAQVATELATYDGPTNAEMEARTLAAAAYATAANQTTIAGYLDTEVAAIKAKTDNLPAAPAATGDIPSASAIATQLLTLADGVESGLTVQGALRLAAAVLAGKVSISGNTVTFRNVGDTKNRVVSTTTAVGARTAVTTDVS